MAHLAKALGVAHSLPKKKQTQELTITMEKSHVRVPECVLLRFLAFFVTHCEPTSQLASCWPILQVGERKKEMFDRSIQIFSRVLLFAFSPINCQS